LHTTLTDGKEFVKLPMENINSNNAIVHSMNRNPIISFSPVGLLPSASQSQHLHDQRDRYDWTGGADAIPGGAAF